MYVFIPTLYSVEPLSRTYWLNKKWKCSQRAIEYIGQIQSVPRSKHFLSVMQISQLMLYKKIIAVCYEIHTKHINTLCGLNVRTAER
jgi:hypothetical protein